MGVVALWHTRMPAAFHSLCIVPSAILILATYGDMLSALQDKVDASNNNVSESSRLQLLLFTVELSFLLDHISNSVPQYRYRVHEAARKASIYTLKATVVPNFRLNRSSASTYPTTRTPLLYLTPHHLSRPCHLLVANMPSPLLNPHAVTISGSVEPFYGCRGGMCSYAIAIDIIIHLHLHHCLSCQMNYAI